MEVERICSSCKTLRVNQDLETCSTLNQELAIFESFLCSKCNLVLKSKYSKSYSDSATKNLLNIPKQAIYFHTNDDILNIGSQNETNDTIFQSKTVLVVGSGSIKRMHVLQSILKFKFKKIVYLCREKNWAFEYFDDLIHAEHEDIAEKEETLAKVKDYMNKNYLTFDAILTYDDLSVLMTSYLASHFNLPSLPFDFSTTIRNKYEMRKISKRLGISAPNFFLLKSNKRRAFLDKIKSGARKAIQSENGEAIRFPVIAKNPLGLGKGLY